MRIGTSMATGLIQPVSSVTKAKEIRFDKQLSIQEPLGYLEIDHKHKVQFSTPVDYRKVVTNVYLDHLFKANMLGLRDPNTSIPPVRVPGAMYRLLQGYKSEVFKNIQNEFRRTQTLKLGENIDLKFHAKNSWHLYADFINNKTGEVIKDIPICRTDGTVESVSLLDIHQFYIRDNLVNEAVVSILIPADYNRVVQLSITVKP